MTAQPTLIAVFGATGTGKTTFVNDASGGAMEVGDGLDSCTKEVAQTKVFDVDGRDVSLIDTPGFDDTELSDTEILKHITGFLSETYKHGHKLTGIIYLHRITDPRMGGISRRTFKVFRELCGTSTLANVLIVTNMWADPPTNQQLKREKQLKEETRFFQPAIEAGAEMVRRLHKDAYTARSIVRTLLKKNPVVMQIQRELVDDERGFFFTGAAQALNKELVEMHQKHQVEMAEVKEELRQAKENNDAETQRELRAYLNQAAVESTRLAKEIEALRQGFEEERKRWEQRIRDAEQERLEAEQREQVLNERLRRLQAKSEAFEEENRQRLKEEVDRLMEEIAQLKSKQNKWDCIVM